MIDPRPQANQLQIAMLGLSRVGKTSLLTAIYSQFVKIIDTVGGVDVVADSSSGTAIALQDKLDELQTLDREVVVQPEAGIKGSAETREFIFSIQEQGRNNSLKLRFVDYPGGYLGQKSSSEEKEFVRTLLETSDAVLIAIDAAALMETDGQNKSWHQQMNRPQQITDLFRETYSTLISPRLVILCPVKCEKYMLSFQDPRRRKGEPSPDDLQKKVETEYQQLINYFKEHNDKAKIAVVITPVQTTGCIFFSMIAPIEEGFRTPAFYFMKRRSTDEYNPKDAEQPLLWLLPFLLQESLKRRPWYQNAIFAIFELDKKIKESIKRLEGKRKTIDGFKLLQSEDLLRIR